MDRQTMKIAGEELKKVNNFREIGTRGGGERMYGYGDKT